MLASDRKIEYFLSELKRISGTEFKGANSFSTAINLLDSSLGGKEVTFKPSVTSSKSEGYITLNNADSREKSDSSTEDLLKYVSLPPGVARFKFILSTTPLSMEKIQFKLCSVRRRIKKYQKLYDLGKSIRSVVSGNVLHSVGVELSIFTSELRLLREVEREYMDVIVGIPGLDDLDSKIDTVIPPRKISGELQLWIFRRLEIIPPRPGLDSGCGLYYILRVDDVVRYRSSVSNSNRWNETTKIRLHKASTVEISVYSDNGTAILSHGILWFDIADLLDFMRCSTLGSTKDSLPENMRSNVLWLEMEPRSWVLTRFEYKSNYTTLDNEHVIDGKKNNSDIVNITPKINTATSSKESSISGVSLRRAGVVRPQFPKFSHIYLRKIIFGVMLCSVCEDKCRRNVYICKYCKNAVHPKCYNNVMWTCLSEEVDSEYRAVDPYGSFKNYNIPHITTTTVLLTPTFCNHCGVIMPPGKKVLTCKECKKHFHSSCITFIPNFCGLKKKAAFTIINALENNELKFHMDLIKNAKRHKLLDSFLSERINSQLSLTSHAQYNSSHSIDRPTDPIHSKHPDMSSKGVETTDLVEKKPPDLVEIETSDVVETVTPDLIKITATNLTETPEPNLIKRTDSVLVKEVDSVLVKEVDSILVKEADSVLVKEEDAGLIEAKSPNIADSYYSEKLLNISKNGSLRARRGSAKSTCDKIIQSYEDVVNLHSIKNTHSDLVDGTVKRSVRAVSIGHAKFIPKRHPKISPDGIKKSRLSSVSVSEFVHKMLFNHQSPQKNRKKMKKLHDNNVSKNIYCYTFLAVLGRGAFGTVYLAKEKSTSKLFAVKALKKRAILQNGDLKSLQVERNIFFEILSYQLPYLISLNCIFQSEYHVFFVMEYINGGDLMTLIMKRKKFPIQWAKFYSCELILVLEFFHSNNIIYRDLKLDNILLCSDGHIKVTDYGICKENICYGQKTSTFCGTPDYMAPEVLMNRQYDRSVDWWSFGILLYVMIAGKYPFRGEENRDILRSILKNDVNYPSSFPPDLTSLIKGLLETEPHLRLGSGPNGANEIKSHPFYKGVNWNSFYSRTAHPPWKPSISCPEDVNNFDTEFTSEPPVLDNSVNNSLSPKEQEEFSEFTFMA